MVRMSANRRKILGGLGVAMAALGGCTGAMTKETSSDTTTTDEASRQLMVETLHFNSSGERCPDDPEHSASVRFLKQGTVEIKGTILFPDTCSLLDPEVYLPTTDSTGHAIVEIRKSESDDKLGPCTECDAERDYRVEIEFNRLPSRVSVIHSPPSDFEAVMVTTTSKE